MVCSAAAIATLLKMKSLNKLKNLISVDQLDNKVVEEIQSKGLKLFYFWDLVES